MRSFYVTIFTCICLNAFTQNLELIGKPEAIKVSGGFNATAISYTASGINARRDPFNYFLSGNVTADIYGISVPVSFSYSNQQVSFRQPFNQFSIAPTYKWAKVYAGYHSLTYSSYSLVGHIFSGAAIELTPSKFRLHAMYGTLNQAVEEDTIRQSQPAYRRVGYAVKTGYGDNQNSIDLILFKAEDEINSLRQQPVKAQVFPMENLVISAIAKKKLGTHFTWSGEIASSALTRDTRVTTTELEKTNAFSYVGGWFTPRASSEYHHAMKTSLGYTGGVIHLQLNYERVDPGYQSLGSYFFNNDMENITVSTSVRLLQNKLDLSANVGTQRNNLNDAKLNATSRTVGTFNFNFNPSLAWNVTGSYSNFTTFTRVRPRFDPFFNNALDSLNFYQINQNITSSVSYSFGSKEVKQGIFFNGSFQMADETAQENVPSNDTRVYTGNLAYRYTKTASNLTLTAAVNYNRGDIGSTHTLSLGPNLSITKSFLEKKLRCTFTATYNQQFQNQILQSNVMNLRANGSYSVKKKHAFSINVVSLTKFAADTDKMGFSEYTATINYGYSF
ncbi:MAG: hypothetical protein ACK5PC_07035 [Cyclobacteriaceae bacterium]|jgi:hypothetical protein|nr:hypothetical protein [Flammeovirgaceae bacterium]